MASNEIKDKRQLIENRKLIETVWFSVFVFWVVIGFVRLSAPQGSCEFLPLANGAVQGRRTGNKNKSILKRRFGARSESGSSSEGKGRDGTVANGNTSITDKC